MDKQQDKVSFTAGPWLISTRAETHITTKEDRGICSTGGYSDSRVDSGFLCAQNIANAHLIAASPCMYEALRKLVALDDERDGLHENTDRIDGWAADYRLAVIEAKAALSKANPNSNLTPSELRDKLDAVEVIGEVS